MKKKKEKEKEIISNIKNPIKIEKEKRNRYYLGRNSRLKGVRLWGELPGARTCATVRANSTRAHGDTKMKYEVWEMVKAVNEGVNEL